MLRLIISAAIIAALCFVGNMISGLIGWVIPGSIIGMILLFTLLCFGVIKEQWIQPAVDFLLKYMVVFFLPAMVGIMVVWSDVKGDILTISIATIISTLIVMVVVGKVQQKLGKRW